jgi:ABC-2 type transport system permease protein
MGLYILLGVVLALVILRRVVLPLLRKRRGGAKRHVIKNRSWIALQGLTVASMKMYFRNRTALFFSLFFPIVFIVVFGFIFKNNSTSFKIDVTNQSSTQMATAFEKALKNVPAFKIKDTSVSQAANDLDQGNADLTLLVPQDFGAVKAGHIQTSTVEAHYNADKPGNGQAAGQIVEQLTSSFNDSLTKTPRIVSVKSTGVQTKNLTYIDFLLPGMIGLSVMQIGIFSVAFAFVSYKTTGMLRRLQATPIHPSSFLAAQGFTRLIVAVVQTAILAGIGVALFSFHLAPKDYVSFIFLALLGSAVFQMIGFGIAGWAKDENQAQPVAQLIQFPMMFLSGTFFPRDSFPHWLNVITGYLPLTYLADALRQVANTGASLWDVRADLTGLIIWGVVCFLLAVRLFSWE